MDEDESAERKFYNGLIPEDRKNYSYDFFLIDSDSHYIFFLAYLHGVVYFSIHIYKTNFTCISGINHDSWDVAKSREQSTKWFSN